MQKKIITRVFLVLWLAASFSVVIQAQVNTDLPEYVCQYLESVSPGEWPTEVDWEDLPTTGALRRAQDGRATQVATEVRLGWNDEGIFVRWECQDPKIWCSYTHRDDPLWNQEAVEIFISTSEDPYHYYEYEVSPNNLIVDLDVRWTSSGGRLRMNGDIHWNSPSARSRVEVVGTLNENSDTDTHWTAELFIPFVDIGVDPSAVSLPDARWRVNLFRIDRNPGSSDEFAAWNPTMKSPASFHVPERFGILTFTLTGQSTAGELSDYYSLME